jgi:hypothetical protein
MEDDLKNNKNGRRPQKNLKKIFSQFLLNLGANLSWDWLSSLRFYTYSYHIPKDPHPPECSWLLVTNG